MKKHIVLIDQNIRTAIRAIKKSGLKCVVVVNNQNKMLGIISDGDIRKLILKNISIKEKLNNYFNKNAFYLIQGKYTESQAKSLFLKEDYAIIPVLNKDRVVKDILYWSRLFGNKKNRYPNLNVPAVIMAGGKGSRMEPFTKVLPKPLIPINEKPVIQYTIDRFLNYGVKNFVLTINFKADLLKAYYKELKPKYKLKFITEKTPLGTAGSLKQLNKNNHKNFFVTNCDTITEINLLDMYKFHISNKFGITVVASTKTHEIPYGVCKLNAQGNIDRIEEKPKLDFLANIGLYLINTKVLKLIPKNKLFHMTDLIGASHRNGFKVGVFPINEKDWFDVGQWSEYKKTVNMLS